MTSAPDRGTEVFPGLFFSPRQMRMLKIAVVVMGIILIAGFLAIVVGIFYQSSKLGKSTAAIPADISLALEPGQNVSHIALDGDRMAVHLTGPGGQEIRIIDLERGTVAGRVRLEAE